MIADKKMSVPLPIYRWLQGIKDRLSEERGRNVTYPEVWEHVRTGYQAASQPMAQVTPYPAGGTIGKAER